MLQNRRVYSARTSMSKRPREESLVDPTSGALLRGDELFADKQRLLLILEKADYQTVSAFERASKRAREFVRHHQIWRTLFQRDYSDVYQRAFLIKPLRMSDGYKQLIDSFTVAHRKGREETYWKRYYEFLVKTREQMEFFVIRRNNRKISSSAPPDWDPHLGSKIDLTQFHYPHEIDGNVPRRFTWIMRRDPNENTVYYYRIFVRTNGENVPEMELHPKYVAKFNMYALSENGKMEWFDELASYESVIDHGHIVDAVSSHQGFMWCVIFHPTNHMYQVEPNNPDMLVSCSICGSANVQLHSCECCGEIYCGRECQKANH